MCVSLWLRLRIRSPFVCLQLIPSPPRPPRPFICTSAPVPLPSPLSLQDGRTALHCAATHGSVETVRLLLVRGAGKDARDRVRVEGICNGYVWQRSEV